MEGHDFTGARAIVPFGAMLKFYISASDKVPFQQWLRSLKDKSTRARILQRIDRLRLGNFGDCCNVGLGVYELRLKFGPGFRIYFGLQGSEVVVLLWGGDKSSQSKDISIAQQYWQEYLKDDSIQ